MFKSEIIDGKETQNKKNINTFQLLYLKSGFRYINVGFRYVVQGSYTTFIIKTL